MDDLSAIADECKVRGECRGHYLAPAVRTEQSDPNIKNSSWHPNTHLYCTYTANVSYDEHSKRPVFPFFLVI